MQGIGGYNGWRWIFIIEGIATVIFAAVSKLFIVDWPETSKFLTVEERQLLARRLSQEMPEAKMDHLDKTARRRILTDWKIYVGYAPNCRPHRSPSHTNIANAVPSLISALQTTVTQPPTSHQRLSNSSGGPVYKHRSCPFLFTS